MTMQRKTEGTLKAMQLVSALILFTIAAACLMLLLSSAIVYAESPALVHDEPCPTTKAHLAPVRWMPAVAAPHVATTRVPASFPRVLEFDDGQTRAVPLP